MKISEARYRANKKWDNENMEHIGLAVRKGIKDVWKKAAADRGLSLNAFVISCVKKELE